MLPVIRNNSIFPGLVSNLFNDDFLNNFFDSRSGNTVPAVNIVEGKNDFKIEVAAPGLEKGDFKINVENDMLIVSADKEARKENNDEKFIRREFSFTSFKRAFSLPEDVDAEKISASHKEGVLTISIPKKEEKKAAPSRAIEIR